MPSVYEEKAAAAAQQLRREAPSAYRDRDQLAAGLGLYASDIAVPQQPLTAEIQERLLGLLQTLQEADGNLAEFRMRMFGPWPEAGHSGQAGQESKASLPAAGELLNLLTAAASRARTVLEHTRVVASAI